MPAKHYLLLAFLLTISGSLTLKAQINHRSEVWGGYIGSYRLSEKWALWNDFHWVPNVFFASRQGLTYRLNKSTNLTAGYAWVSTATSFSSKLIRGEHRPWGQMTHTANLSSRSNLNLRFRYDRRIRQTIENQQVTNNFLPYSRLRFMLGWRYQLSSSTAKKQWFFNLQNEFLYDHGQHTQNGVDQNRLFVFIGQRKPQYQVMGGYHLRIIPSNIQGAYTFRHGASVWVIHTMQWQKK